MPTPIVQIDVIPIQMVASGTDLLDASAHTVLVRLQDAEGRIGIGETDAPPSAVKEFLEMPIAHGWSQSICQLLLGEDPVEIASLWEQCYQATIYVGRRGLGIHALSAVDLALHDLAGQQLGLPAYKLLGGRRREKLTPYATLYSGLPGGRSPSELIDDLIARIDRAKLAGFRAVKVEALFETLVTDRQLVDILREGRSTAGGEMTLLVDFGYRFTDWRDAAWVLNQAEDCDLYLAEAVLPHDDLVSHARLAGAVRTRIGGAEFAATRFECQEWLEKGRVDVLQPDINRCGGLTEIKRIAQLAEMYGASVIPHAWKTGITVAACQHFQAATPNAPFFEFLSPALWTSRLRATLTEPEPVLCDGTFPLPEGPGLGIHVSLALDGYPRDF